MHLWPHARDWLRQPAAQQRHAPPRSAPSLGSRAAQLRCGVPVPMRCTMVCAHLGQRVGAANPAAANPMRDECAVHHPAMSPTSPLGSGLPRPTDKIKGSDERSKSGSRVREAPLATRVPTRTRSWTESPHSVAGAGAPFCGVICDLARLKSANHVESEAQGHNHAD